MSDYHAALSLLNDSTMSQACALLLSDADYEETTTKSDDTADETSTTGNAQKNTNRITDKSKLFNLYRRCQTATNIIAKRNQKQQTPPPSAGNAVTKKTRLKKGIPVRTTRSNKPHSNIPVNRRASSDESSAKSSISANNALKKKKQSPASNKKEKDNPPAAALAFLAALNKQKNRKDQNESAESNDVKSASSSAASTPPPS